MAIKYVKAIPTKSSKITKAEKPAAEYGDVNPPTKKPRKFAPPVSKNYSTKSLEPKHTTYRGGSR